MATSAKARSLAAIIAASAIMPFVMAPSRAAPGSDPNAALQVQPHEIDDLKSVYATVRSKNLTLARVRTPGTISSLKVDYGDRVKQGQVLALVVDPKIALRMKALDARIVADQSRVETAKTALDRIRTLQEKGVASQASLDQAQTAYDVAVNELKSANAERSVIETESAEGEVLAPTSGRVLKVPVTEGSVVMAGESIATIAANAYLLRLVLPERHARFMKAGDSVRIGARGLSSNGEPLAEGRIVQVYPELDAGQVLADAEVPGLGDYFVGERVLVWISAGKRSTFVVPRAFVFKRYGLDFVHLKDKDGSQSDVVVQTGRTVENGGTEPMIEILAGIESGDLLVHP